MSFSVIDFAASLRIADCRIRNTSKLIFLCGGLTSKGGRYRSARDFFCREVRRKHPDVARRVTLAEDVNSWFKSANTPFDSNAFQDLLELEEHLADLAEITLLFVESPGSIAELGAFAVSDLLRPKTLAIVNNHFGIAGTFITDGPVRRIRGHNKRLVHRFRWNPRRPHSPASKREFGVMTVALLTAMKTIGVSPGEEAFRTNKPGHVLLLVADLIRIGGVCDESEIKACLDALECDSSEKAVNRYLSLLRSVGLIHRAQRADQDLYTVRRSRPFIRYAFKPGVSLKNELRIITQIRRQLDPLRVKLLKTAQRQDADV